MSDNRRRYCAIKNAFSQLCPHAKGNKARHLTTLIALICGEDSISGILLTALNQKAKGRYLRRNLGFQEIAPGSRKLLPGATMRMLPGAANLRLPPEGF